MNTPVALSDGRNAQTSSSVPPPPPPLRRRLTVVSFCLRCAAACLVVAAAAAAPVAVDARSRIITAASSVADEWCAARMRRTLAAVMVAPAATMDLSGYAIHRALRSVPGIQMYMTGIQATVTTDGAGRPSRKPWTRVDGCRYFPADNVLEARMHFGKPLTVTGTVRLLRIDRRMRRYSDDIGAPAVCNVAVRLRGAGVSLSAAPVADLSTAASGPAGGRPTGAAAAAVSSMTIRTTAVYTDTAAAASEEDVGPLSAFVSVHAYQCADALSGKQDDRPSDTPPAAAEWTAGEDDDVSRVLNKRPQQLLYGDGQRAMVEIEEALVRGVRQLLAKHLERTLQPALRESLMNRMGYVVSYG